MQEELRQGKGRLLSSTWILSQFLLYLTHLILLPFLSSSSLVLPSLAEHAAAVKLFGSLSFMAATLPLSNDGLVNLDVEIFPHPVHLLRPFKMPPLQKDT